MQINRIPTVSLMSTADRNIQAAQQRLAAAQEKASSLKELSRPSDDPTAAAEAMAVRAQQRAADQHGRNINNANGWLSTADNALSEATALMHQARDTVLAASNHGALNEQAREAYALQLESIRDGLLSAANTQFAGRSVFAGTSDAPSAFSPQGEYRGVAGDTVQRNIGPTTTIRVDADGEAAFGSGENSIFALLDTIAGQLRAGEPVSGHLDSLQERMDSILSVQAVVGANHATALRAQESLVSEKVALETRRSALEDADLASAALELQTQEVAYQAALASSARILQTSLMDYLR